jgi:hypothetical protein
MAPRQFANAARTGLADFRVGDGVLIDNGVMRRY